MLKLLEIDKRYKFLIQSVLFGISIYVASGEGFVVLGNRVPAYLFGLVVVLIGTFIVHYPNTTLRNFYYALVLPVSLFFGAIMAFHTYPNLSRVFKVAGIAFFCLLYYLVCLMDNIFLVIHSRDEVIPLFRVAMTWTQIFQVLVSIPLFASIYRYPLNGFKQIALVIVITFIFNVYQMFAYRFDPDSKTTGVGEVFYLSAISSYLQFSISSALIFFPAEAFLRGLVSSAALLFGLNFVNTYLKNEINRKIIMQYTLIVILFLSLFFFFRP